MTVPKVSIIVPVYNVEKYISACLDSLVNQTLRDIEIICVNDATPDNSIHIIEDYMRKDRRIRLVHHEVNQGLGPARNSGVEVALAPYVGFVDSDDMVALDMFEKMYNEISIVDNIDLVCCPIAGISEDGLTRTKAGCFRNGRYSSVDFLSRPEFYELLLPCWNKLYKTEYVRKIKQLPIVSEDQPFLADYIKVTKNIFVIEGTAYFYRNRFDSLSKPKIHSCKHWDAFFYAHKLFFSILRDKLNNTTALPVQVGKRFFSVFWRIRRFELYKQPTWDEQRRSILIHLRNQDIPIKDVSVLLHVILYVILNFKGAAKTTKSLSLLGQRLCNYFAVYPTNRRLIYFIAHEIFKKLIFIVYSVVDLLEMKFFKMMSFFVRKKVWLVGERLDTAQENGKYFYEYIKYNHPEIKVYYVDSSWANTFKHKLLFYSSDVYANSHYNVAFPHTILGKERYKPSKNMLNVFLQHGITCSDVSPYYGKKKTSINMFVCGATPEYEAVSQDFGYNKNEVVLTGFARFDGLASYKTKRQILLMPTWRRHLMNLSHAEFVKSDYFVALFGFLSDSSMQRYLRENDLQLVFAPHYEMHVYIELFAELASDVVHIVNTKNTNVQNLLKESELLITDVSSVQFDFAYMRKPVIYFWWDYEHIIHTHLKKGYFDFETMGFGTIVKNKSDLIDKIIDIGNNNWENESIYMDRINQFFPYHDTDNCERIYREIMKRI